MNIRVVYHSKTGNTKKIADAISEAVGVTAEPATEKINFQSVDLIFIGDGVYGGKPNISIQNFIKTLSKEKVKNAVVFGTFGGQPKAILSMQETLRTRGIKVLDETFGCKGKAWWIMNKNRPNEQDINDAKEFARNAVAKLS